MRWLPFVVALAGCDVVLGLQEQDPGPGPGNEDGDTARDEADNCPGIRNDQGENSDGDGVGDACDPAPTTPGDRILAFYGFDDPDDLAWETASGNWVVADGQVTITSTQNVSQSFFTKHAPLLTPPYTVEAHFTITEVAPFAAFGVLANTDSTGVGAACSLLDHGATSDRVQAWFVGTATENPITPLVAGESYRATFFVGSGDMHCEIEGITVGQGGAVGAALPEPRAGHVGLSVFGTVTVAFDYLVVYGKD